MPLDPLDIHETAHWHGGIYRHPHGDVLCIEGLEGFPSVSLSAAECGEIREILDALQSRMAQEARR